MTRVAMVWMCSALVIGCSGEQGGVRPRQAGDLQAEYETQQQAFDECLLLFADCAGAAADPVALGACADDLEGCLGAGPGGSGSESGTSDGGSDSGTSDGGGSDSGTSDDGGAGPQDACQPLLDACLADPLNFDPTCLDGYEACVQDEIDGELAGLCDELEAECESFGIPSFDCASVCP
jgi:hypothetical protein